MGPVTASVCAALVLCLGACGSEAGGVLDVTGVGAPRDGTLEPLPDAQSLSVVTTAVGKTLRSRADVVSIVSLTGEGTELDLGPLPNEVRVTGSFDFAGDRGRLTATQSGHDAGTIREIFTPRTVYIANLPNERSDAWVTVTRATMRTRHVYRTPANDPRLLLLMVAGAEEMARQGPDTVDGNQTTRFRGYLYAGTLTSSLDPAVLAREQRLMSVLGPQGRRVQAWVDRVGYLVRLRLGFRARQGDQRVQVTVQLDLSRFGARFTPAKIDRRSIVPAHELTTQLLG